MNIFYSPEIKEGAFVLRGEEAWHGVKVLRLKEGGVIYVSDGMGKNFEAEILGINKKNECALMVRGIFKNDPPRIARLHIAIAPTKNIDRFEWFLEKATECGIDEITPVLCENSERNVIKPERLSKILVSAMKQSLRAWLPKLNPMVKFSEFVSNASCNNRYIAYCDNEEKNRLIDIHKKNENSLILIGPEGDFSSEEISIAKRNNFLPLSLGNYRLRTETAGLVACVEFNCLNG